MKRLLSCLLLLCFIFCGCRADNDALSIALTLREALASSNGCSFLSHITADFGDKTYSFSLQCHANKTNTLSFTVIAPETISGISGTISGAGGKLTFDDKVLAFPLLADGEVSPISAPWLLMKSLMGGYISSCGKDGEYMLICIDDSYEADALQLDIWTNNDGIPVSADILWQGRRVLSLQVEAFTIL